MTREFPYVQLPGAYRGFFRKASLWEGMDHILAVSGSRFNDEYRRFYYRDIQAFIVEKRPRAGSLGWWTVLLIGLVVAIVGSFANSETYWWGAVFALLLILIVRLDLTFRRSCRCSIQTAVSREYLPSLMRVKDADKVISRLQIRIAAEQGELPPEMPAAVDNVAELVTPPDPAWPSAAKMLEDAAARSNKESAVQGVDFSIGAMFVLLLNAVATFWISSGTGWYLGRSSWLVEYLFTTAGLILTFLALQKLAGLSAVKGLRILLVSVVVLGGLRLLLTLLGTPIRVALGSARGPNFLAVFNRYYSNTNGGLQFTFAAVGLILIFAKWEQYRRGEPSSN